MEPAEPTKKHTWNKPEQRFSIAVDRLLDRALLPPAYYTALHDADGTTRTDNQRARDRNRGIKSGQLDWDVVQAPGLVRKLELKRGKGHLSANQVLTIEALNKCGVPPIVAWDLRQVHQGLALAGFRFSANVGTVLAHLEAELAGWDREAELIKSGQAPAKKSRKPKAEPRFQFGTRAVARARKAGIRV
jgi:hypothetical protein